MKSLLILIITSNLIIPSLYANDLLLKHINKVIHCEDSNIEVTPPEHVKKISNIKMSIQIKRQGDNNCMVLSDAWIVKNECIFSIKELKDLNNSHPDFNDFTEHLKKLAKKSCKIKVDGKLFDGIFLSDLGQIMNFAKQCIKDKNQKSCKRYKIFVQKKKKECNDGIQESKFCKSFENPSDKNECESAVSKAFKSSCLKFKNANFVEVFQQ